MFRKFSYYTDLTTNTNQNRGTKLKMIAQKGQYLQSPIYNESSKYKDDRDDLDSVFTLTGPKDIIFVIEASA